MLKKFLFSLLASLVLLFSIAPYQTANAQSSWYNSSFFDFYDKVYNENTSPASEIFGERYTAAQVQWVFFSVFAGVINLPYTIIGLFGVEVQSPTPTSCVLSVVHGTGDIPTCVEAATNFLNGFVNRFTGSANVAPTLAEEGNLWKNVFATDRQLSLIGYVANIGDSLSIVPVAHAQETGFGLSRLLVISDFWKITRNAAYGVFVVAIIAIAFMIMFRVKISPQAIISVQSAIPNIAITLILITFSLAIAGLLVDLMYIVTGFVSTLVGTGAWDRAPNPAGVYEFIVGPKDALLAIGVYFVIYIIAYLVSSFLVAISALATLNLTSVIFGVLMLLFSIILFLILVWSWLKTMFVLIKTTALIYVTVIVAPLQIMMGVFPGPLGANAFSGWIKSLISKLAVFPVTGLLLFFSFKFLGMSVEMAGTGVGTAIGSIGPLHDNLMTACTNAQGFGASMCGFFFAPGFADGAQFWGPPLLGNAGAITGLVFLLISVGAVMMVPKVTEMIEGFLAGKPIGFGSGIGEAIGPVGPFALGTAGASLAEGNPPPILSQNRWFRELVANNQALAKGVGSLLNAIARGK